MTNFGQKVKWLFPFSSSVALVAMSQGFPKVPQGSPRFPKVPQGSPKFPKVPQGSPRFPKHSRMRRQSSALVTATDKNSGIGVLFDVDHDVNVRKHPFQRSSTLKFLKNFRTFFSLILGNSME